MDYYLDLLKSNTSGEYVTLYSKEKNIALEFGDDQLREIIENAYVKFVENDKEIHLCIVCLMVEELETSFKETKFTLLKSR